jgi:hypothetical protein
MTNMAPLMAVTLTESGQRTLNGTANLSTPVSCGFASSLNYSVAGEHNPPGVVMTLEPTPGQGVTATLAFTGTVDGADAIVGALDGTSVTLTRHPSP